MAKNAEALLQLIRSRRTIRDLRPDPVPKNLVEEMLEMAIMAPSAHNAQPWRFVVLTDPRMKAHLAEEMATAWREDLRKDGITGERAEMLIRTSRERTLKVPAIIIVCLSMEGMNRYPDERQAYEYIMAVQSVSAAIENLLLAAHALGLGACWRCAPLFCKDVVRRVLHIPEGYDPQAMVEVGYPARIPEPKLRRPLKDVVHHDRWGG